MTSMQESAPGSKSTKFVQANPLDPMIRPFENASGEQENVQQMLADNVNQRLEKTMEDLKEKHRTGTNEIDDPDRAPTGMPYQQIYYQQQQAARQQERLQQQELERKQEEDGTKLDNLRRQVEEQLQENAGDSDDDDDWLEVDDAELDAIRQRRLAELRKSQIQHAENVARGHGEVRTILQDEFLPECTGSSEWVAVHFFHGEFSRCEILDHHLKLIAPQHLECKFLRLDAQKAPFFVTKLQLRTLPSLLVFQHGKAVDRLVGFDGLAIDPAEPDKWKTTRLQEWLAKTGAITYKASLEDLESELDDMRFRNDRDGGMRGFDEEY